MAAMLFIGISLTMTIGFAYLGFYTGAQSENTCYANSTYHKPFYHNTTTEELYEYNAKNVTQRFHMLLTSGFYILSVYTSMWVLYVIPCVQDSKRAKLFFLVAISCFTVIYFGHFILANVYRFENSGRVCAGEFGTPHNITDFGRVENLMDFDFECL